VLETFSSRNKGGGRPPAGASAVPSAAGVNGGEMVDTVNIVCKLTPYLARDFPSEPIVLFLLLAKLSVRCNR